MKHSKRGKYDDDDDEDYEDDDDDYEEVGRRRGMSGSKKIFLIFVVIAIIIIAAFSVFWLNPSVKDVIVGSPVELDDETGISLDCHIALEGGGSANGFGDIEIVYKTETVYSDEINIKNDVGKKEIPYDEFVVGNDKYVLKITFNGKSGSREFKLYENFGWAVAENINVTAQRSLNEKADDIRLKVTARLLDSDMANSPPPKQATVEITIKYEGMVVHTDDQVLTNTSSHTFDNYNYLTTGSGNYTVEATLTNDYAKSNTLFEEIETEEPTTTYENIWPEADAGNDQNVQIRFPPLGTGEVTVEFDGSGSWNDDPDGISVLSYDWDFDYKDDDNDEWEDFTVDATGVTVDNTYTLIDIYTVALRVRGVYLEHIEYDGDLIPLFEEHIDTCEVRVTRI